MSFNAIDSGAVMKELLRLPWKGEEEEEEEEDVIEERKFPAVRGPSVVSLVATRQPIEQSRASGSSINTGEGLNLETDDYMNGLASRSSGTKRSC
jgi:hypothetical protein